ncbi:MAG TPA: DUF2007 domain-containing protein [Candidatus Sulfotelmatobacter sp.]|nr:DUF2007 domain-containing protein [Candidatus Sulfotelmatobacter sp.]
MAELPKSGTEAQARPNPNEKLVRVFDSEQESEAMVVKGLLESAGIDSELTAIDFPQDTFPIGGSVIVVREEDAEAARRVIADFRQQDEAGSSDADSEEVQDESEPSDTTEEPPTKA